MAAKVAKVAVPAVVGIASIRVYWGDEESKEVLVSRAGLNIYTPLGGEAKVVSQSPGVVERGFSATREKIVPVFRTVKDAFISVKNGSVHLYHAGEDVYYYLIDPPPGFLPRLGTITMAGLLGMFLARRGSRLKRIAVPLGLMSAAASVCYPAQAVAVLKLSGKNVYAAGQWSGSAVSSLLTSKAPAPTETVAPQPQTDVDPDPEAAPSADASAPSLVIDTSSQSVEILDLAAESVEALPASDESVNALTTQEESSVTLKSEMSLEQVPAEPRSATDIPLLSEESAATECNDVEAHAAKEDISAESTQSLAVESKEDLPAEPISVISTHDESSPPAVPAISDVSPATAIPLLSEESAATECHDIKAHAELAKEDISAESIQSLAMESKEDLPAEPISVISTHDESSPPAAPVISDVPPDAVPFATEVPLLSEESAATGCSDAEAHSKPAKEDVPTESTQSLAEQSKEDLPAEPISLISTDDESSHQATPGISDVPPEPVAESAEPLPESDDPEALPPPSSTEKGKEGSVFKPDPALMDFGQSSPEDEDLYSTRS